VVEGKGGHHRVVPAANRCLGVWNPLAVGPRPRVKSRVGWVPACLSTCPAELVRESRPSRPRMGQGRRSSHDCMVRSVSAEALCETVHKTSPRKRSPTVRQPGSSCHAADVVDGRARCHSIRGERQGAGARDARTGPSAAGDPGGRRGPVPHSGPDGAGRRSGPGRSGRRRWSTARPPVDVAGLSPSASPSRKATAVGVSVSGRRHRLPSTVAKGGTIVLAGNSSAAPHVGSAGSADVAQAPAPGAA
jgi:hypothetical protein